MNAPVLRCSRCHRVRDAPGQDWRDHPAKLPREVEGTCSLCMELSRLLSERKWQREGRELRVDRDGSRVRLGVWVGAGTGASSFGELELDAQGLRQLIAALRDELHQVERAQALSGKAADR